MEVEVETNPVASTSASRSQEQFLILAKTAHGAALRKLIEQELESPDIYVFGELLELTCVQELCDDPEGAKYLKLLNIFAYGTYKDYVQQAAHLLPLSPLMSKKLRQLTVVSLAAKSKYISYESLLAEVDLNNVRELEDLLISAIYSNIIRGKLDQQNSRLEVDWTIGRDLTPEDLDYITNTLSSWCSRCETMVQSIGTQIVGANTFLSEDALRKSQINTEVENIMSTIKKASGQEPYISMSDSRLSQHPPPSCGVEIKPKKSKVKGLRGSGMKLWSSSKN
uniref:COP9 signalosome complex subunit 7a-like n=1 Tax=Phallusia mammillata TaxID=59560 RepID=A0A6F9DAE2_9ASCI|nr:COP9 signalosome complex subunit 7a-like [Phallusia mammillata]